MPDWAWAHAELRRPGVTLTLLWQEYRLNHPQGFQYSWYCEHYRRWAAKVDVVKALSEHTQRPTSASTNAWAADNGCATA